MSLNYPNHVFLHETCAVPGRQTSSYEITLRPWTSFEPTSQFKFPWKKYAASVLGERSVLVLHNSMNLPRSPNWGTSKIMIYKVSTDI